MISLHEMPDHVSAIAAVASIGTGRTTMVALDLAKVSEDDVVLVTAAASGMGNLLVQATVRHLGATVIGVAGGAEKVARVRELGADVAVESRGTVGKVVREPDVMRITSRNLA